MNSAPKEKIKKIKISDEIEKVAESIPKELKPNEVVSPDARFGNPLQNGVSKSNEQ